MIGHNTERHTKTDDALDAIYAFCDVLMHAQSFPVLDSMCRSWPIVPSVDGNLDQTLGLLTATAPVKSKLPWEAYGNENGLFDGL